MLKLHEPLEFTTIYYDIHGKEHDTEPSQFSAKKLISNRTGNTQFYIKSCNTELYNPLIYMSNYHKQNWKFLKFSEAKFHFYVQFLQTKQIRFLTQAERL